MFGDFRRIWPDVSSWTLVCFSYWVLNKTLRDSGVKKEMTVEKVESCSYYTFAVRCALDEAPWSDWSQENTVLTKLNSKNTVKTVHASASQLITAGY